MIRVAAVQLDITLGDPVRNLEALVARAGATDADLLVFPECSNSGYGFSDEASAAKHAESIPGPTTEALQAVARARNRTIIAGLLETDGRSIFNAAAVLTPDGRVGKYRKVHLPFLGLDRFTKGGDGFPVFDTPVGRVGVQICYDLRFPEASRALALEGAEILAVPTNWPRGAEAMPDHLVTARAVENRVFVVTANRVGTEAGTPFIGRSAIVDVMGRTIASLGDREGVLTAEIEPALARDKRIVNAPGAYEIDLFADRRPAAYGPLFRLRHDA